MGGGAEADINYSPVIWNPWAKIVFAWLALGSGSERAREWVTRATKLPVVTSQIYSVVRAQQRQEQHHQH